MVTLAHSANCLVCSVCIRNNVCQALPMTHSISAEANMQQLPARLSRLHMPVLSAATMAAGTGAAGTQNVMWSVFSRLWWQYRSSSIASRDWGQKPHSQVCCPSNQSAAHQISLLPIKPVCCLWNQPAYHPGCDCVCGTPITLSAAVLSVLLSSFQAFHCAMQY